MPRPLFAYANCWEDISFAARQLRKKSYSNVLSICSGGDNTLSLLPLCERECLAVDMHVQQLYLLELKATCIATLPQPKTLEFLGFRVAKDRLSTYKKLRGRLSEKAREYFDAHQTYIANGIIKAGKLDAYFAKFAAYVRPLIHRTGTARALLAPKSADAQHEFYTSRWANTRWLSLLQLFFAKPVMALLGRDSEKFDQVETSVAEQIKLRSQAHLSSVHCQRNGFLHYLLVGGFEPYLPDYLQADRYLEIRANLHKLRYFHGTLEDVDSTQKFDLFNLSNIFEYMPNEVASTNASILANIAAPQAELFYWNLMVQRALPTLNDAFQEVSTLGLGRADWGFFYDNFQHVAFKPGTA